MWRIAKGQFLVMNGNGGGEWVTVAPCKPDTWYTVRQTIYIEKQCWHLAVGGTQSEKAFGFRFAPKELQMLDFLVEGKAPLYLDAIRILEAPAKK